MLLVIKTFQLYQHHTLMKQRDLWTLFCMQDTANQFNSLRCVLSHCKRIVWLVERDLLFLKQLVVISNQFNYLAHTNPCYQSEFVSTRDYFFSILNQYTLQFIKGLFHLVQCAAHCGSFCARDTIVTLKVEKPVLKKPRKALSRNLKHTKTHIEWTRLPSYAFYLICFPR